MMITMISRMWIKAAADGNHDDPQQPQNQQDQRDCEQHSNSFNGWMLALG